MRVGYLGRMSPPSRLALWIRLACLFGVGGLLALSPIPRQVFGQGGRGAPRWSMFSDVIEPGVGLKAPGSARLRSYDLYEARTRSVCREHRNVSNIEVELFCPGRRKRQERREDVCEMSG
jgi:hypothetical protein